MESLSYFFQKRVLKVYSVSFEIFVETSLHTVFLNPYQLSASAKMEIF